MLELLVTMKSKLTIHICLEYQKTFFKNIQKNSTPPCNDITQMRLQQLANDPINSRWGEVLPYNKH